MYPGGVKLGIGWSDEWAWFGIEKVFTLGYRQLFDGFAQKGARMVLRAAPRLDLEAHEHAARIDFPVVVKELSDLLGAKLVAYIAGVTETRAVRQWAEREREPRDPIPARLRLALHVALLIARRDSARVAQAWFQGLNPQLDDRSPARLLREEEIDETGPKVLSAARAFASSG